MHEREKDSLIFNVREQVSKGKLSVCVGEREWKWLWCVRETVCVSLCQ